MQRRRVELTAAYEAAFRRVHATWRERPRSATIA
jgi:hypothetical protein